MSEDIDILIDINLTKIAESEDFSAYRTNFVESSGGELADTDSTTVAKSMDLKGLINLHPAGYKCDIMPFGHEVHNSGGWLKYLANRDNEREEAKQKKQLDIKITKLTAINLELQNKQLKTRMWFSIIGFIFGAIVTNWKEILILLKIISQPETK